MKKHVFLPLSMLFMVLVVACKPTNPADGDAVDNLDGNNNGPQQELTVDEQKDYFDNSMKTVLGYFNPQEQAHAVEVAENLAMELDSEWDIDDAAEFFSGRYERLFRAPAYICGILKAQSSLLANPLYRFSFANDAMVFEGNTATHILKNMGPSKDGKYTVILHDGSNTYTVQVWGEGKETLYSVNLKDFGGEDKVYEAMVPERVVLSFRENDEELIGGSFGLDMVKDDHVNISTSAHITTLSFAMDEKLNSTAAEFANSIKVGDHILFGSRSEIPSLPILIKMGGLTYEEWVSRYGEQWESLVRQVGDASFVLNVGDCVQLKGKGKEGGKLYTELDNLLSKRVEGKQLWSRLADIINEHAELGMYFSSNVKQADIKMDLVLQDGEYFAMPLLFFEDGSSYDLSSYFMQSGVYDSYLRQIENLLADYESLFKHFDVNFRF